MAISEIGRIGQWGTSTPSNMPTSGEVVAETSSTGRLNIKVSFCEAAGFKPSTPSMVQLAFDKPFWQGGTQLVKMPAYTPSYAVAPKESCPSFAFQMAPEQVMQHKGRRVFVHLYVNGMLLRDAPVERTFVIPMTAPTSVERLLVTPTPASGVSAASSPTVFPQASWPNPAPTTVSTTVKRDVQVLAPIVTTQPTLAPAVQAAAAALLPTPSAVKTNEPTPAASTTKMTESGSLMPTTLLPKGAVQLPVKAGFGTGAYAAMGLAILAGFWWHRKSV